MTVLPSYRGRPATQAVPTLVPGRERELAHAAALYEDVAAGGSARLLVLRGAADLGLAELERGIAARLELLGAPLLGRRAPSDGVAYGPFAAIVRDAGDCLAERLDATWGRALGCADGCHALWFEHPDGGPARRASAPSLDAFRPDAESLERRLAFFAAVAALLDDVAAVRAPVLLLGDLARVDPGALDLLDQLLSSNGPESAGVGPWLAVAHLHHEDDAAGGVARLLRSRSTETLRIEPFDLDQLRVYVTHPTVLARLHARTEGRPARLVALLSGTPPAGSSPASTAEATSEAAHEGATRTGGTPSAWPSEASRSEARPRDATPRETQPREPTPTDPIAEALDSGDEARAATLAGDRARALVARLAHAEAASLLEDVVERVAPDLAVDLRALLAELCWALGRRDDALRQAVLVRDARPDDPWASLREAHLRRFGDTREAVESTLDEATRRARRVDDARAALQADVQRAELSYRDGRMEDARAVARSVVDRAEACDAVRALLDARNTLGKVALASVALDEAAAHFTDNVVRARSAGMPRRECQARNNLAIVALRRDDLDEAERHLADAVALASAHGAVYHRAVAVENLAVLLHVRGHLDDALVRYQEAVQLLKLLGDRDMLARAAFNLAELYADLGDLHRARGLVSFGEGVGSPGASHHVAAEGLLARGRVAHGLGSHDEANASYSAALELAPESASLLRARATLGLTRVALDQGRPGAAQAHLIDLASPPGLRLQAELARVRAELARATRREIPEDVLTASGLAIDAAELSGDQRAQLAAWVLHAGALADAGRREESRAAAGRAWALDDRIARRVPPGFLPVFERRSERLALARLDRSTRSSAADTGHKAVSTDDETSLEELFYRSVRDGRGSIYDVRKTLERQVVERALSETGGNITQAARLLGMKRPRLSQLLKEYGGRDEEPS